MPMRIKCIYCQLYFISEYVDSYCRICWEDGSRVMGEEE